MAELPVSGDQSSAAAWRSRVADCERRGEFLAAYDLARRGLAEHSDDPWLKHRAVLALARSGATEQARDLFHGLGLAGDGEEEIATLGARLAKDHALAADGAERRSRANAAADLYQAICERTGGYYPGINAATMRLLAGKSSEAAGLARGVLETCAKLGREARGDAYYLAATQAEAHLLLGDRAAAREMLRRAAAAHGGDYASVATTRKQLRLICVLKGDDVGVLAPLASPTVIHYVGHMIAAPGQAGRFAAESEPRVAARIATLLADRDIGYGYGSLACGADILFAEAILARGAEVHVVMPFGKEEFKDISVARGGVSWPARFDRCLANATSVSYATEDSYLGDDELFAYASRLAMGLALLRATYLDTGVAQFAVWDGKPVHGPAGTAADIAFWRERGFHTEVIECGGSAVGGATAADATPPGGAMHPRVVRAMLFGDVKGFSRLREVELPRFIDRVMGRFGAVLDSYGEQVLYRNTWGDAVYVVLPDAVVAARCAMDLQAAISGLDPESVGLPSHLALRLGGHIGPVFQGFDPILKAETFFGAHVSRTARIEPVTPEGQVYVTEPFAAALATEPDTPFNCEYVGHMPAAKDYGRMRMYVLRRRSDPG